MIDRQATRAGAARPAAARRRYYVYVLELDDAVGPRRHPSILPSTSAERSAAQGAPSPAQGRLSILSVCAQARQAPSPAAVSALQSDGHARGSCRDGAGTRQAPAQSWLHGVRRPLSLDPLRGWWSRCPLRRPDSWIHRPCALHRICRPCGRAASAPPVRRSDLPRAWPTGLIAVLSIVWLVRATEPASKQEDGCPTYPARPRGARHPRHQHSRRHPRRRRA
jgi:hypothetical protein